MNGEEFGEELYRENLYFVYEDKCRELEKELDKFRPFTSAYEMKKEIKRLNNIINELEKGIKENIEELEEHQLSKDRIDEDKEILRFLQELKGSSNNE